MKISKAWCGLFTSVGAGVGLTAYLANRGSEFCQSSAAKVINSFLDAQINLSGLNTTITIQTFPYPLRVSLGELNFNLRHALTNSFIDTLQNLPQDLNGACKSFIWEQGAIILLTCAGLTGLGLYTYKKFQTQVQEQQRISRDEDDEDRVYHSAMSINLSPSR